MLESDYQPTIACLREHFPSATDGDASIVWEDLRGYSAEDASNAIVNHRRESGNKAWRPDPKRLKMLAHGYFVARQRARSMSEKIIDGIRRMDSERYYEMNPGDILMDHFSRAWAEVKASKADENGKVAARAYIYNHAKRAGGEIGWNDAEAEEIARYCVELKDGERIVKARMLRTPDFSEAKSFDALKRLSMAVNLEGVVEAGSGI